MKIKTKINITFIVTATICFGILGYLINFYSLKETKKTIYTYLHASGRARAEHIITFLDEKKTTAKVLAAASVYRDLLKEPVSSSVYPGIKKKIDDRLQRTLEMDKSVYESFIIDRNGIIIASSNKEAEGLDKSQDDYFTKAKNSLYFKDVYFSGTINKLTYAISVPVTDSDGSFLGVSVLRFLPNSFYSITTNENGLGDTEENFIVNSKKFLLTPTKFLDESNVLKTKIDTKNASDCFDPFEMDYIAKNGYSGLRNIVSHADAVEAKDYRNVDVIATHTFIAGENWCLITKVDKADALKAEYALLLKFWVYIVISFIIFISIVLLFINKIIKSILTFITATKIFNSGDTKYRIEVKTKDEVGDLAASFNSMVTAVVESREDIEKKVAEQTQDLRNKEKESEDQRKAILNILEDVEATNLNVIKEKDKLDAILHSIGDAVFVVDSNMNVILINDVAIKMTGYTRDEILNKKYKETLNFVFEETGNINDLFITNAIKTKQVQEMSNHTVLINKAGQKIHVADSAAPLLDITGNVFGCVVVFRDVTHEREVDRAKTEFVSLASHQLRTPLTPIRLFSEMLLNEEVGKLNPQQREYVDSISQSSKRMISLVNDLLNVSRLELGRLKIEPVSTDMIIFLRDVIKEVIPACDLKGCKIILNEPSEVLPNINIDQTLLRQVIHNLLTNAIRYSGTEKDSLISVSVKRDENNYLIGVKDNGIGIPKDAQEHMFEKFYRAENAIKAEGEGSGLGLYIIKMIVESSKGKIWFESPPKGEINGTVFYVSIPINGMAKKEGDKGMIAEQI